MRALAAAVFVCAALGAAPRASALESPEPPLVLAPSAPPLPASRDFRVGFLVGLVGVPHPLGIEALARVHELFGLGFGVGVLPAPLGSAALGLAGINDGSLNSLAFEGEVRLFPFRGAFWLGGALGHMGLSATGKSHGQPVAVDVSTLYAAPRLGWLGTWQSGFLLGLDLGVQLPLSTDVVVATASPSQTQLESFARALAGLPLPTLSVRLGWML